MDRGPRLSRRAVLAGGASLGAALAGCVGRAKSDAVSLLAAGSLNNALENGLAPAMADAGVTLRVEARGSAEAARLVAGGEKTPDVVSLADVGLFDGPLAPAWYAEFAANSLVIAYDPASPGGRAVAKAGPEGWYRPILDGDVSLGRTDPDLDPLGYRTLFALELATDHYGTDRDLRAVVPERDQVYPETQLMAGFETGSIDAAVVYRNMATERGYDFLDLPPEIDLGDPAYAERYARATHTLPGGKRVRGGVISYGTTIREGRSRPAVRRVFEEQIRGEYLEGFGLDVPDDYPRFTGDVPDLAS